MNLNDTEKESNCTCAAVSWSSQSRCGMVVHGREWETQNASICFRKRARALITSASLSFLSMLISLGADLNVVVWVLFFSFFFLCFQFLRFKHNDSIDNLFGFAEYLFWVLSVACSHSGDGLNKTTHISSLFHIVRLLLLLYRIFDIYIYTCIDLVFTMYRMQHVMTSDDFLVLCVFVFIDGIVLLLMRVCVWA